MTVTPIDPGVRIGHVHLKVADIDRALAFYCGVLGFQLMQRRGPQAVFISAGGYHHHKAVAGRRLRRVRPGSITWRCSIRPARRLPTRCGD
jgi:catechol-2,3-dioxygenase